MSQRTVVHPYVSPIEFSDVMGTMGEGVAIFDDADRLVYFNKAFEEAVPELREHLQEGIFWDVFLFEAQRAGIAAGFEKIDVLLDMAEEKDRRVEVARGDGRTFRIGFKPKQTGGFILLATDITEEKRLLDMHEQQHALLEQVLNACDAMIVMSHVSTGEAIYRTPAATKKFGRTSTGFTVFGSQRRRSTFLADLLSEGQLQDYDVVLQGVDGPFPAQISSRLIDFGGEQVIISTTRDMTQSLAQQEKIKQQQIAQFQTEKLSSMGELLAGVAHELNNPLSVVAGQALMLQEEGVDPASQSRASMILEAAERCTRIVQLFLAMARQKPMKKSTQSLSLLCDLAIEIACFNPMSKGCKIERDFQADIDVFVDEDQVSHALANLVVNAIQAACEASEDPTVLISTVRVAESGQAFVLIDDNGAGVPESDRERVFEPFYSSKKRGEGTGFGLMFSRKIFGAHGGSLSISRSALGGARLVGTIPEFGLQPGPVSEGQETYSVLTIDASVAQNAVFSSALGSFGVAHRTASSNELQEGSALTGRAWDAVFLCVTGSEDDAITIYSRLRRTKGMMNARFFFVSSEANGAHDHLRAVTGRPVLAAKPKLDDIKWCLTQNN